MLEFFDGFPLELYFYPDIKNNLKFPSLNFIKHGDIIQWKMECQTIAIS